jgi:hypothetical protein
MVTVTSRSRLLALTASATTAAVLLAGCGGESGDSGESAASATSTTPSASTVSPSDMTDQQQAPARLTIDVDIKGGNVTPTNAQFQAKVNQPIVIRVSSDADDELHVHSTPEHTFKVEPKTGQQYQFSVAVPGNVDVELHHLGKVIATIQVQQ